MVTRAPKKAGRDRALPFPITLRDGRKIETMAQAVALVVSMPPSRLALPVWDKAMEDLLKAQDTGKALDLKHANAQLKRALEWDGFI